MEQPTTSCGACGTINAADAIVCASCGAILAAYAPPPGSVATAAAPPIVPPAPTRRPASRVIPPPTVPPSPTVAPSPIVPPPPAVPPPPVPGGRGDAVAATSPVMPPRQPQPATLGSDASDELHRARFALLTALHSRPATLLAALQSPERARPIGPPELPPVPIPLDVLSSASDDDRRREGGPLWQAIVAEREGRATARPLWQAAEPGHVGAGKRSTDWPLAAAATDHDPTPGRVAGHGARWFRGGRGADWLRRSGVPAPLLLRRCRHLRRGCRDPPRHVRPAPLGLARSASGAGRRPGLAAAPGTRVSRRLDPRRRSRRRLGDRERPRSGPPRPGSGMARRRPRRPVREYGRRPHRQRGR